MDDVYTVPYQRTWPRSKPKRPAAELATRSGGRRVDRRSAMPAELHALSKRENMSSDTGLEELDLELAIRNWLRLSYQLVKPLFWNRAIAPVVNINPVSGARRLSIDEHAKSRGNSASRPHD